MINLEELTIKKINEAYKKGEFTPVDLVDAYIKNIEEKNPELNAVLEVFEDAKEAAKKVTDFSNPLAGIPVIFKDNIMIDGKICSASSKILENYKSTYNSTVTKKLGQAGSIFLGRANCDEFAMGASTDYSAFGVTKNPHDLERVAGGSSGGSAAAVASDMSLFALGSDTGGSVRNPAAFCGIVGLKPTYGSVSRNGLMAMASSFDVIGPLTKTVEDSKIVFDAIKGVDPLDQTTAEEDGDDKVKKVGVPRNFLKEGMDEDALQNFEESLKKLEEAGYEIVDIDVPSFDYALAVYYILVPAEVSSNMARYDGIKYGESIEGKDLIQGYFKTRGEKLGEEVKRRIMLGTYVLSSGYADEYYRNAWKARNAIKKEIAEKFEEVDVIALPTYPGPAPKIGELTESPLKLYLADIFTVTANVAGVPAISVPSGTVKRKKSQEKSEEVELPLGIQFFAPWFKEQRLFKIGSEFEKIK
jgi:aspartyl-tRNA(Asn)/glutamyl-tRNA(Gln) amidotransferase subunit A